MEDNRFSNLPSLVLIKILKYLSFKDRMSCSRVCRAWRSKIIVDYKNQNSLFFHFDSFPFQLKDSYSNELIKYENSIQMSNYDYLQKFLISNLTKLYFENLKQLTIFNIEQNELSVTHLDYCINNNFCQLEQLSLIKLRLETRITLNLAKLKVLILKNVLIVDKIDLNTFNLTTLICWTNLDRIQFRYPNKLINLEYKYHNLDFDHKFINLECLKYFNETGLTKREFLGDFKNKKLKSLIVYSPFVDHDVKELKRQKEIYKLEKLKISSFGFQDDSFIHFPINHHFIYLRDKFKLKELFNNYSKLNTKVSFPVQIDFCPISLANIPKDFFNKIQIHQLNVCWNSNELIENFDLLIKFIKYCGFLPKLILNNCGFRQNFYDQLCLDSSIGQLEIKESSLDFDRYNFLRNLIVFHLKINLNTLSIDLIRNVLMNKNLKYFEFDKKNTRILIKLIRNQFYLMINRQKVITKFDLLDSLIDHLKMNSLL